MRALSLICAGVFAVSFSVAAADGLVLRTPAVLFDSHSSNARKLFVLSAGYPLREITRVDGWRKVSLPAGESGWVREQVVRSAKGAVVSVELAAVKTSPSPSAPEVFYARQGVALEVLKVLGPWVEVLHPDGETGYVSVADVWLNY